MSATVLLVLGGGTVLAVLVALARAVRRDGLGRRPPPSSHDDGFVPWRS